MRSVIETSKLGVRKNFAMCLLQAIIQNLGLKLLNFIYFENEERKINDLLG